MKALLFLLALLVFSLAAVAVLLHTELEPFLTEAPEQVAQEFFTALAAKRYESARRYLSNDLQEQTSPDELREEKLKFERQHGLIEKVTTNITARQEDSAEVEVTLRTSNNEQVSFDVTLRKEQGEWRLISAGIPGR